MTRMELLDKYALLTDAWMDKEAKLENFVQRWLDGEIQMSAESIQKLVDTTTLQIEQLKIQAAEVHSEYMRVTQEEAMRKHAVRTVRYNFGVSPDEIIITGGVLSSNADESHLIGKSKTPEELEEEGKLLLAIVKEKAMKKETTLARASELSRSIKIAYASESDEHKNTRSGMKK